MEFCSLGSLCHSSQLLKRNNFKKCSYPFDWIFSSCDIILDCIEDDFKTFLDKSCYIHISEKKCGHSKYGDEMFNHHNPLTTDYDYFVRCVNRFRDLLKSNSPKLFVMTFVNMDKMVNFDAISKFNDAFSNHTSNYILLVIYHKQCKEIGHKFTFHKNIHFLELHTLSKSTGLEFDNIDNVYLDNILKTYR